MPYGKYKKMYRFYNGGTHGREREKFPISLPHWLEDMIKAQGITLDNLKKKLE